MNTISLKYLIFGITFFSCSSLNNGKVKIERVSENSTYLKTKNFEGVIFSENYLILVENSYQKRFTPTIDDVKSFEKQLETDIAQLNRDLVNQGKYLGPIIHNNLGNYVRQYFGVIDENGDEVLFVNFIWDRYTVRDRIKGYYKPNDDWKKEYNLVADGGSRYWNIKINLSKKTLFDFRINGVA